LPVSLGKRNREVSFLEKKGLTLHREKGKRPSQKNNIKDSGGGHYVKKSRRGIENKKNKEE